MIVYVESNLVLEIVLEQEHVEEARQIVVHAERGDIQLVVPALALVEPVWTLQKHRQEQEELHTRLEKESSQHSTSVSRVGLSLLLVQVQETLTSISEREQAQYDDLVQRLLKAAEVIALSPAILGRAESVRRDYKLQPLDAVILASVLKHLHSAEASETKLFVEKDKKDFNKPEVHSALKQRNCRPVWDFSSALKAIQAEVELR